MMLKLLIPYLLLLCCCSCLMVSAFRGVDQHQRWSIRSLSSSSRGCDMDRLRLRRITNERLLFLSSFGQRNKMMITSSSSSSASYGFRLSNNSNDKDNEDYGNELQEEQDNFDGAGLVNYLAPYALALVVSVAVTAGFVKFVLMDY